MSTALVLRGGAGLLLPRPSPRPLRKLAARVLAAVGLIVVVALIVYSDREGYVDGASGTPSFADALYYASVTVTTTGYGDVVPVTDRARLATTLLVTPARVVFLLMLVGTTIEVLSAQWRDTLRTDRWRKRLEAHVVVVGYGTKGRAAIAALCADGTPPEEIVVVEAGDLGAAEARAAGYAVVQGDASRVVVLEQAETAKARAVIVAPNRDDSATLVTLTARELAPGATIVSAVREEENRHLLLQSGADSVITSAEASGRMLGIATRSPALVRVMEDLLTSGEGFDLVERAVRGDEVGGAPRDPAGQLAVAVVRDGQLLHPDDERIRALGPGDRVVCVNAAPEMRPVKDPQAPAKSPWNGGRRPGLRQRIVEAARLVRG